MERVTRNCFPPKKEKKLFVDSLSPFPLRAPTRNDAGYAVGQTNGFWRKVERGVSVPLDVWYFTKASCTRNHHLKNTSLSSPYLSFLFLVSHNPGKKGPECSPQTFFICRGRLFVVVGQTKYLALSADFSFFVLAAASFERLFWVRFLDCCWTPLPTGHLWCLREKTDIFFKRGGVYKKLLRLLNILL